MRTNSKCCEDSRSKIVQCEEVGMVFRVLNPSKKSIKKCLVDKCLILSSDKKCDFLIKVADERSMLVELKGTDRKIAVAQLLSTGKKLGSRSSSHAVECYIVTSRTPKADTSYQKTLLRAAKDFRKENLLPPKQVNRVHEVKV